MKYKTRPIVKWLGFEFVKNVKKFGLHVNFMAGICSAHMEAEPVEGCAACHSTPAKLLGVTEDEWAKAVACAEACGRHTCTKCGFVYYKNGDICPLCYHRRENTTTTILGSWWTAVKNWLGITAR